jgi:hypothetical protein
MGVMYIHSPKSLSPFPKLPKKFKTNKKIQKNGASLTGPGVDLRLVGDRWSPACQTSPFFFEFFSLPAFYFLRMWSTLAATHARPSQILPKNFKHP